MKGVVFLGCLCLVALTGCRSSSVVTDKRHPDIAVAEDGAITWRGRIVTADEVVDLLDEASFTKEDTIHIRIPENLRDYRVAYGLMRRIAAGGYSRPVLVSDRRASAEVRASGDRRTSPASRKAKNRYPDFQ